MKPRPTPPTTRHLFSHPFIRNSVVLLVCYLNIGLPASAEPKPSFQAIAAAMIFLSADCFVMGSPAREDGHETDETQHRVCIDDFYIASHEITFDQYAEFSRATGYDLPDDHGWGMGDRPVIEVSWFDAIAYTEWLRKMTGLAYRLPTEAEWEYAARGSAGSAYWWGETASREYANFGHEQCCMDHIEGPDQWHFSAPVGSFPGNRFGLFDSAGNVAEWTCSEYGFKFSGQETTCPDPIKARYPVIRGGSWLSAPAAIRAAARDALPAHYRHSGVGFRIARSP